MRRQPIEYVEYKLPCLHVLCMFGPTWIHGTHNKEMCIKKFRRSVSFAHRQKRRFSQAHEVCWWHVVGCCYCWRYDQHPRYGLLAVGELIHPIEADDIVVFASVYLLLSGVYVVCLNPVLRLQQCCNCLRYGSIRRLSYLKLNQLNLKRDVLLITLQAGDAYVSGLMGAFA